MHGIKPLAYLVLANRARCRDAVEVRHLNVHENAAEGAAGSFICRDRERAVRGSCDGEILPAEVGSQKLEVDGVVINNEVGCDI